MNQPRNQKQMEWMKREQMKNKKKNNTHNNCVILNFDRRTTVPVRYLPEDIYTEVRPYIAHTNSYGFVGVLIYKQILFNFVN